MAGRFRLRRGDASRLTPLFAHYRALRSVIDSVLEGHLGRAWADHPEWPAAARLDLGFAIRRLDTSLAAHLGKALEPHALQVFRTPGDFSRRGIGFGIHRGGLLVSAATTYAISSSGAEIAVSTRAEFRGQGLAAVASARLLLACREQGLQPSWNAANPASQRLALRLGFRPAGACPVSCLT